MLVKKIDFIFKRLDLLPIDNSNFAKIMRQEKVISFYGKVNKTRSNLL